MYVDWLLHFLKGWVLVCWWWFHRNFLHLIALVGTTTSIVLLHKIQNGDIGVMDCQRCRGKWLLNKCHVCGLGIRNTGVIFIERQMKMPPGHRYRKILSTALKCHSSSMSLHVEIDHIVSVFYFGKKKQICHTYFDQLSEWVVKPTNNFWLKITLYLLTVHFFKPRENIVGI